MAAHPLHSLSQGIGVRNSLRGWTLRHIAYVPSTYLSQLSPTGSLESVWPDKQSEPTTIKHESDDVKNAQENVT